MPLRYFDTPFAARQETRADITPPHARIDAATLLLLLR